MLRKILLAVVACVCVSSAFTAPTVPYRWVTTKDTLTPTKLNKNNDTIYNAVRMLSDTVKYKYPRWVQFKDTTIDLLKTDSLRCVFYAAFDSIFTRTLNATGFMTCDSLNVRSINSAVINSVSFVGNVVGNIIGSISGYSNTQNSNNVGSGYQALSSITSGTTNTAMGYQALAADSSAGLNAAFGYHALNLHRKGDGNTGIGYNALASDTLASANVAVGTGAMYANKRGNSNIAIGYYAENSSVNPNNNITIGYQARISSASGNGNVVIGTNAMPSSNNTFVTCIGTSSNASKDTTFNVNLAQIRSYADSATAYSDGIRSGCIYRIGGTLKIMY
jgi:hypothetical protein